MNKRTAVFGRVRRVLLAAGVALAALPAAPALATTIGQTGGAANATCVGTLVRADTNYVVPSGGGTITSFSFASVAANSGQTLDFLILRPTSTPRTYTVVGKTGLATLQGTGGVETFPANIPVQSGDILGFWHSGALTACLRFDASGGGINGGGSDPSVGDTVSLPNGSGVALNLSANLVTLPTSKAQCKKGGWRDFEVFKNQGDCVSFVATGGKNPPAGAGQATRGRGQNKGP